MTDMTRRLCILLFKAQIRKGTFLRIYLGQTKAMQFTWHGTDHSGLGVKKKEEQRVRKRTMDKKGKLFKT